MVLSRRSLLSGLPFAAASPALAKTHQITDLQSEIDKAADGDGVLVLPAGDFEADTLSIKGSLVIQGQGGRTRIIGKAGKPTFKIEEAEDVSLTGLHFIGSHAIDSDDNAMVFARNVKSLVIEHCLFTNSRAIGLRLEMCSGAVRDCRFANIDSSAIFAIDSRGLEITGNTIQGMGTNGIQIWASEPGEDGTLVAGNRISKVSSTPGDTGQTGNGISVFRAGNVTISGNRITDCAYSAIRNNSGSNCQIVNNSISRTGEVALYCEFAFDGAIVTGNLMEDVRHGISITNFDYGGRLAVCSDNIIRRSQTGGIHVEAQTVVNGNVIESAIEVGISLGWSWGAKSLSASNNIVTGCGRGITFSVAEGAEPPMIVNNRIIGSRQEAIAAMNFTDLASGDLALPGAAIPEGAIIHGNLTR